MLYAKSTGTEVIMSKIDIIEQDLQRYEDQITSPALMYGKSGIMLFYAMYYELCGKQFYADKIEAYIYDTVSKINNGYTSANITDELIDFGTFLEFLNKENFLSVDTNAILTAVDILADRQMRHHIDNRNYDSATGALKAGYYFIHRLASSSAAGDRLNWLAEQLEALVFHDKNGYAFWKSKLKKDDRVYLTMPHGSADVIVFLSALHKNNIATALCCRLIDAAMPFLLYHKSTDTAIYSRFPNIAGDPAETTRLALYYGDLGITFALEKAAAILNNNSIKEEAASIWLQMAGRRNYEQTQVQYAAFIYGSAGNMHMFSKKHLETGNPLFEEAADYWLEQTLQNGNHNNGYAGFVSIYKYESDYINLTVNTGFAEGIAGIGSALCNKLLGSNVSFETLLGYM
jgi:lantibiotic biosynthesis protein